MNKKVLLLDSDGVIVDFVSAWCKIYNEEYDDNISPDIFAGTFDGVHKVVKPECGEKVYDLISNEELFANLKPMPDAIDSIERIVEDSRVVSYIVTAYSGSGEAAKGKIRWIKKNLPFFDSENVLLCKPKHLVYGNVMLDDSLSNLQDWHDAQIYNGNDDVHPIAMAAPHNKEANSIKCVDARVSGWKEFLDYLESFIL